MDNHYKNTMNIKCHLKDSENDAIDIHDKNISDNVTMHE